MSQRRQHIAAPTAARGQASEPLRMADIGKKGPGNLGSGKGEVQTGSPSTGTSVLVKDRVKEKVEDQVQRKEQLDKEKWWRVILHNDDIHTFDYVTLSITKVVKKLTMKIAYEITMETHKAGKATVTQAWKSQAETYCLGLQQCGLTASIA
ncbi:ribosomal protein L7/L12, C-terminal/adaptor protein ClpS-like protein, partial [Tribonema minus]